MKAVFLDRDGVINELITRNEQVTAPWSISEFKFFPNVKQVIDDFKKLGYMIFIVTNQPGINDGDMNIDSLDEINKMLFDVLKIDDIICALDRNSDFYKPNNGMVELFISKHNIDRDKSFMVGDTWKDIVCGTSSKVKTIYVGQEFKCPIHFMEIQPNYIAKNIQDAYEYIKGRTK